MIETPFGSINSGGQTCSAGWLEAHWAGWGWGGSPPAFVLGCSVSAVEGRWEGGASSWSLGFLLNPPSRILCAGERGKRIHTLARAHTLHSSACDCSLSCQMGSVRGWWRLGHTGGRMSDCNPLLKINPESVGVCGQRAGGETKQDKDLHQHDCFLKMWQFAKALLSV